MIQSTSFPSNMQRKVSAVRDFPPGCGTQFSEADALTSETEQNLVGSACVGVADQNYHRAKEDESVDLLMKKAGFGLAANHNVRRLVSAKRTFPPLCDRKVKPLSSEETIELLASQSKRRWLSESSSNVQRMEKQRNSLEKKKKKKNSSLENAHKPTQERGERFIPVRQPKNQNTELLSPREKVQKALRLFRMVFRELDGDKAARRGESKTSTSRIDYETRDVLLEMKKHVNAEKMIGSVPGIEVADEFQYKSELNIIGLHFNIMGGIDYMSRGDLKLATSIVASEGYGYVDKFESDEMIYTGEGGNVIRNDQRMVEDQRMVKGNLALFNSMKAKTEVRVIRGFKRFDQKGKHYVYDGLYLVNDCWRERGRGGNLLFKFKLRRISGQPCVPWKRIVR